MTQTLPVGHKDFYNGTVDCFRKVYKTEGFCVFWSGTSARVAWISLGGAIFFGVYETVKMKIV